MQTAAPPRKAIERERAAETDTALDDDPLIAQFFSQPPPQAWEVALDDWQPRPLSRGERRAMFATFALLGCGAFAAFAFLLFPDAWLVTPAPLRGGALPLSALASAPVELGAPLAAPVFEPVATAPAAAASAVPTAVPVADPVAAANPAPPTLAVPGASAAIADAPADRAPADAAEPAERPARTRAQRKPARTSPAALVAQARRALHAGDARRARDLAARAVARAPAQAAGYIVLAGAHDALGERASMRAAFRDCAQRATDPLAAACKTLAQ